MSRIENLRNLSKKDNLQLMKMCGTRMILDKDSYDSIIHPITSKEEINNGIIYSHSKDKNFRESLNVNFGLHTQDIYSNEIMELVNKLLSFGGSSVCVPQGIEDDLEDILKYGQFWFGRSSKLMKGTLGQCHRNSCLLWDKNKDISRICTGYALSDDGIWHQHSWIVQLKSNSNQIIETTIKRIAYFGFVMTEEQANDFYYQNI